MKLTLKVTEVFKGIEKSAKIAEFVDSLMPKLAGMLETEVKKQTPVLTGNLASSIVGIKTGFLSAEVGTPVNYASYVEFGTGRMSPRAMFRKGADVFLDSGEAFIAEQLKKKDL